MTTTQSIQASDYAIFIYLFDIYICIIGAVYFYHYSSMSNAWSQCSKLKHSNSVANDYFGTSLFTTLQLIITHSYYNEILLIGAYGVDAKGDARGLFYVYIMLCLSK
jgi:hypothetical protein